MADKKVTLMSFGFKYRRPPANYYIDVSFIKNPAREKKWDLFSTPNKEMYEFVQAQPFVKDLLSVMVSLITILIKVDDDCRIAIGCNAGRHRSFIFTELLQKRLKVYNINTEVNHLEL